MTEKVVSRLETNSAPKKKDGNKKSMKDVQVPGWVAAVVIIGFIGIAGLVLFLNGKDKQPAPASTVIATESDPNATIVETLPQPVRGLRSDMVKNPFGAETLGAVTVTGIMMNSQGKSTVILVLDGTSFIMNEGDTFPESEWAVKKVTKDSVTFACEGNEKTVYLNSSLENSSETSQTDSKGSSEAQSGVNSEADSKTSSETEGKVGSETSSAAESKEDSKTESSGASSENSTKSEESK